MGNAVWVAIGLVLAGCTRGGPPHADELFTCGPSLEANPDGAGLTVWLTACTAEPVRLAITMDDGVSPRVQTVDHAAIDHRVLLLGMRPDQAHEITVVAAHPDGRVTVDPPLVHVTAPLPPDFPVPNVTRADGAQVEPGVTLMRLGPYIAMFDVEGVARWYVGNRGVVHTVGITARGTLLMQIERSGILERSLSGAALASFRAERAPDGPASATPVDVAALHHDMVELPDGGWLSLSIERRVVPDYPTDELDRDAPRADAQVAGDVVVEFTADGDVVYAVPLLDVLDPQRIGHDAVDGDYWEGFFGGGDTKDWSHGNAVAYDPDLDEVIVTLRHQDAVVGLDRAALRSWDPDGTVEPLQAGILRWILAPDGTWRAPWDAYLLRPSDPDALEIYHPHAARITPSGTLLVFDNGNRRASAYEPPRPPSEIWSRGVELDLDREARTWSLRWDHGTDVAQRLFSGSQGSCTGLPETGHRLVTYGNVADLDLPEVIVIEADAQVPARELWRLTVDRPMTTFRAARVTGVLPGF